MLLDQKTTKIRQEILALLQTRDEITEEEIDAIAKKHNIDPDLARLAVADLLTAKKEGTYSKTREAARLLEQLKHKT